MENIKIFACSSAEKFTSDICNCLGLPVGEKDVFKFKNDNTFVQFKETVRDQDIYLIQTTTMPVNERVMELLITIDAAKRASARRITVVLPYFIYARTDKKDQSRVPVTAKLMAKIIEAAGADRVITCDLHNSAIQSYFEIACDTITSSYLLADYFKKKDLKDIVVVATDAGSSKRAYKYSKLLDCPMALIDKRRADNNDDAKAAYIIGDVKDKVALIFDDEISTGGTLVEAINICKEHGAKEIYAGAAHGIFASNALERLEASPVNKVVVTDTIPLDENKKIDKLEILSMAPLFAEAIKRTNEGKPLGDLFIYDK